MSSLHSHQVLKTWKMVYCLCVRTGHGRLYTTLTCISLYGNERCCKSIGHCICTCSLLGLVELIFAESADLRHTATFVEYWDFCKIFFGCTERNSCLFSTWSCVHYNNQHVLNVPLAHLFLLCPGVLYQE